MMQPWDPDSNVEREGYASDHESDVTAAPARRGSTGSLSSMGLQTATAFGGGRGWAGWDREEGQRALGQSYHRHTSLLRDSDACSEHGLDLYDDMMEEEPSSSAYSAESMSSSSGSDSSTHRRRPKKGGSKSDSLSKKHGRKKKASVIERAIQPTMAGLKKQATKARRRPSLNTMFTEAAADFVKEIEKVDVESRENGKKKMDGRKTCLVAVLVVATAGFVVCAIFPNPLREKATSFFRGGGEFTKRGTAKTSMISAVSGGAKITGSTWASTAGEGYASMPHMTVQRGHAISHAGEEADASAADMLADPDLLPKLSSMNTADSPFVPGIFVPEMIQQNYADVWEPMTSLDVPMLWHVPRSGGKTVTNIMSYCLGMVLASGAGKLEGHAEENYLHVSSYHDGARYANVDMTFDEGIQRAKDLNLVPSALVDVIVTTRFHEVTALFDYAHRGRAFVMVRHPVKRAVSRFYFLQKAPWDPAYDPILASMTIDEYVVSELLEENWVVRALTNEPTGDISRTHVEVSKEILRRKCLVGIMEWFDESLVRFEQYFGWWNEVANSSEMLNCQKRTASETDTRDSHERVKSGTPTFQKLMERNWADVELYHYAKTLFLEQASLI